MNGSRLSKPEPAPPARRIAAPSTGSEYTSTPAGSRISFGRRTIARLPAGRHHRANLRHPGRMRLTNTGIALSEGFYREVVAPLLAGLPHGAALLGDGSEVLGYDDAVSPDHDFGPRVQVFVPSDEDIGPAE